MATLLRDPDIRTLLTPDIETRHPGAWIRHEVGLCAGERRVDVAAIDTQLHGYEIKSDVDTLARLAGQAEAYGRVFDRMTLVTTSRYLDAVTAALPVWWEVMAVDGSGLRMVREGTENANVDGFALAQLLWRDEALSVLKARGAARGLSKSRRWLVWQRLAAVVPLAELQGIVRDQLRARDWG